MAEFSLPVWTKKRIYPSFLSNFSRVACRFASSASVRWQEHSTVQESYATKKKNSQARSSFFTFRTGHLEIFSLKRTINNILRSLVDNERVKVLSRAYSLTLAMTHAGISDGSLRCLSTDNSRNINEHTRYRTFFLENRGGVTP